MYDYDEYTLSFYLKNIFFIYFLYILNINIYIYNIDQNIN